MSLVENDLTETDLRILRALKDDGRKTNAALAEEVGMAASPCLRRLKRLEALGCISGYRAMLDRRRLGYEVFAIVFVRLEQAGEEWRTRLIARLKAFPEVVACYAITGETDLVLHILARSLDDYAEFAMNSLLPLPGVVDMRSSFVLSELIPDRGVPVPAGR